MRCSTGNSSKNLNNNGGFGRCVVERARLTIRFCIVSCIAWVTRTGNVRRCLDGAQVVVARRAGLERRGQAVGGGDRVLNGEIDADAADRRHRVRRVADADEPGPPPLPQPVDGDASEA